jgi:alpha-tubulin suppressor-like RCC1 family protein
MISMSSAISFRHLGFAILAIGVASCSDAVGPPTDDPVKPVPADPTSPMYVSNPRSIASLNLAASATSILATNNRARSTVDATGDANAAYISLEPQTYPAGTTARITNRRSGAAVTTPMVDGGLDPVPLSANAGDSVSIEVESASGAAIATVNNAVPGRRPPKIVRTIPGRGKTGVPLNPNIEVVFTEPVAPASLSSSVQLLHGNTQIAGTAQILQGVTAAIVFKPAGNLLPNTNYELVVTTGVKDLDGDPVDSVTRVSFTTGTSVEQPVATLTLIPEAADVRVGEQFQAIVVAKDGIGNILTGHPVKWVADTIVRAAVTSTGLVTALHEGYTGIYAQVDDQVTFMPVRVSNALRAVTAVIVAFDSGNVSSGHTLLVGAIATDAEGNVLTRRLIQWSTTNAGTATVAATSNDQLGADDVSSGWFNGYFVSPSLIYWAKVSGIANGIARIVATIEGHSDTVVVTVGSAPPIVGMVLTADTSSLLLHQTSQFKGSSVNSAGGRTPVPPTQMQWETSNAAVAAVDADGRVTGVAAGSATITAHWNTYSASTRVTVVELQFEAISAGAHHTCALVTGGKAYCWGANDFGQLGRPSVGDANPGGDVFKIIYPTPTPIASELTFVAITTGEAHSCGLTATGAAYCWGFNGEGALGSSSSQDSWRPLPVSGGLTFRSIRAGRAHTCGLTEAGAAYCWGRNQTGQTGSDDLTSTPTPRAISGGLVFVEVTAGNSHTCGLTADGAAYCWGYNLTHDIPGQSPGGEVSRTPQEVSGGLTFESIAAGDYHTCGRTTGGALYCWGSNSAKQLGSGIDIEGGSVAPVRVAGGLNLTSFGGGSGHTCALDAAGAAWCWGDNFNEQVGVGSAIPNVVSTPQSVFGGLAFDRLSVGYGHTCARAIAGAWYCWGDNEGAVLGVGSSANSGIPLKILGQQ